MAFIPVDSVAHMRIEGSVDGQETINDLYFRRTTGPITAADLLTLTNAIETWVETDIAPKYNEAWSGRKVAGRDLTLINGFVAEASLTGVVGVSLAKLPRTTVRWRYPSGVSFPGAATAGATTSLC